MPVVISTPFKEPTVPTTTPLVRLRMEGINNSQAFVDDYNHTFVNGGTGVISVDDYAEGSASGYFSRATTSYVRSVSNDYIIGTRDYTIEFFVKFKGDPTGNEFNFFYDLGMTNGMSHNARLVWTMWGYVFQVIVGLDQSNVISSPSWTKAEFLNVWRHIAVTRQGINVYVFVDGQLIGTTASGANLQESALTIGNMYKEGNEFHLNCGLDGNIDNFEFTIGTAKYTANFTPPAKANVNSLLENLKAYWKADETNGTTVSDYMGTYPASIVSGVTFGSGKVGNALIGSTTSRINANSSVSGTTNASWSFWIKGNAPGDGFNRPIIQQRGDGSPYGFENNYIISTNNTGKILFWDYYGGTNALLYSNTAVMNNLWHHIVATRTNNIYKIYVDGALDASQTASQTINYDSNLYFGMLYDRKDNSYHLDASVDDVAIWQPRALTLEEVQDIHTRGQAGKSLLVS